MRAAVFHGAGDIRIEEVPLRKPGPDEVLIRVKACGVCGTDFHIYEGAEGSAEIHPPLIPGHEFSGTVCETGGNVKDLKVDDRVCADPNIFCGKCSYCKEGKVHFCSAMKGLGTTVSGAFAEYITVPEKFVYRLPDSVSFEEGAMAEPVACCLHGMDLTSVKHGDTVLIIGGGAIGLIMLQLAKCAGASKLIVSEPVREKREKALALGADVVVDPVNESLSEALKVHTFDGADVAIECVGREDTMLQAINSTCRGGRVMLFGLTPAKQNISISPYHLFRRELTVMASFINPYTQERALRLLASGRIEVKSLITDVLPLDDINKVFEDKNMRAKGKIMIRL